MKKEIEKRHEERVQKAQYYCAYLSGKYKAGICSYDKTAVILSGITEKQLDKICIELSCSGIYSEKNQSGIITNFGQYK